MILEAGDIDLAKVLSQKSSSSAIINANANQPKNSNLSVLHHMLNNHNGNNRNDNNGSVSSSNNSHNSSNSSINGSSSGGGSKDNISTSSTMPLLDPFFARMVWKQMLEAVNHIHKHRIVHGK